MAAPEFQGGSSAETAQQGRRQRNAHRLEEFQGWTTEQLQDELEATGIPYLVDDDDATLVALLTGTHVERVEAPPGP